MAAGAPANVNANAGYYTVFDANALAAKDGVIVKAGPPTGSELDYPALFLSSLAEVVACTVVGHFSLLILIIGFSDCTARCIVSCGPSGSQTAQLAALFHVVLPLRLDGIPPSYRAIPSH